MSVLVLEKDSEIRGQVIDGDVVQVTLGSTVINMNKEQADKLLDELDAAIATIDETSEYEEDVDDDFWDDED